MSVGLAGALLLPRGWGDQPCPGAWEDGDCLTLPRRLECFLGHQTPSGASSVILCEYIFRSFFFLFSFSFCILLYTTRTNGCAPELCTEQAP